MVTSIARQSVIIKCNQQTSVLLGNYEFYYLAGLMKKLYGLNVDEEMKPEALLASIQQVLPQLEPADEKEAYLIKLVTVFKTGEEHNSQTKELFHMGETEERMWQV